MKKKIKTQQIRGTDTMIITYDDGTKERILCTSKIRTETDHITALNRVAVLSEAKPDTSEGNELKLLTLMIEKYKER